MKGVVFDPVLFSSSGTEALKCHVGAKCTGKNCEGDKKGDVKPDHECTGNFLIYGIISMNQPK